MPTIVGILTFISMKNTTSEGLKARKVLISQHFDFQFHAPYKICHEKKPSSSITSGPGRAV